MILLPANIYDFITSLPQGFDTEVGGKGSQLSGGQKRKLHMTLFSNMESLLHGQSALQSLERFSETLMYYSSTRSAANGTLTHWKAHEHLPSGYVSARLNVRKSCAASEFLSFWGYSNLSSV